ncbi:hypothetical protein ACFLIM_05820 [Nonomuraea sp. M3C6]|uniref:Uncharacterized protein n=1 Tax=Nonomuraea marmarensis TaxID=3351344 RepID=A0ABW7A5S8_9ACTN
MTEEPTPAGPLPLSWATPGRFPDQALRQTGDAWRLTATGQERAFAGRRQEHLRFHFQPNEVAAQCEGHTADMPLTRLQHEIYDSIESIR